MTLLIDSGNTRIKLGWCHPLSGARESQPVSVHADQLDQLAVWLEAGQAPLQEFAQQKGVQALGVNVAGPQVQAQIDAAVSRLGLGPVRWLQAQEQAFGLHNDYEQAGQLGADRWASLLGLSDLLTQEYPVDQGALLISFGTATTIDLLGPAQNGVRHFLGGSILPGPSLMLASLKQKIRRSSLRRMGKLRRSHAILKKLSVPGLLPHRLEPCCDNGRKAVSIWDTAHWSFWRAVAAHWRSKNC